MVRASFSAHGRTGTSEVGRDFPGGDVPGVCGKVVDGGGEGGLEFEGADGGV